MSMMVYPSMASGIVLDYLVAKAEGLLDDGEVLRSIVVVLPGQLLLRFSAQGLQFRPSLSSHGSQGVDIMERDGIGVRLRLEGDDEYKWSATDGLRETVGPSLLTAAMRCRAARAFGQQLIEIPEELLK